MRWNYISTDLDQNFEYFFQKYCTKMDVDAFLQSFSEDYVQEVDDIGILENVTNPLPVSPNNQVTFTYKLEGMEYETILPSPSQTYQLPRDTRLVEKMGNNNSSSSVTGDTFYPGELTPPVSLYSSPLQETGFSIKKQTNF